MVRNFLYSLQKPQTMTNPKSAPSVTAVIHKDSGIVTAFFNELPGLVVQGNDQQDATNKLSILLVSYIKRLDSLKGNIELKTPCIV